MNVAENTLFVLTGVTAVGKTELSLAWAEQHGAEIISCDSLLFYRGMDLGTAKPTLAERARVPHHLVDLCAVRDRMDITRYVAATRAVIQEIEGRGNRVLVVGGSGFYLRAFFAPVADDVEVAEELRAELEQRWRAEGLVSLVHELRVLNPAGIGSLDTANPRRVLRALERCRASGRTLRELAEEFSRMQPPFGDRPVKIVQLDRPKEEIEPRVERRVTKMIAEGLEAEAQRLLDEGLKENPSAARAIGYRETIDLIEGRLHRKDWPALICANTRALVKKQRTWFRTQLPEHRTVHPDEIRIDELF